MSGLGLVIRIIRVRHPLRACHSCVVTSPTNFAASMPTHIDRALTIEGGCAASRFTEVPVVDDDDGQVLRSLDRDRSARADAYEPSPSPVMTGASGARSSSFATNSRWVETVAGEVPMVELCTFTCAHFLRPMSS